MNKIEILEKPKSAVEDLAGKLYQTVWGEYIVSIYVGRTGEEYFNLVCLSSGVRRFTENKRSSELTTWLEANSAEEIISLRITKEG